MEGRRGRLCVIFSFTLTLLLSALAPVTTAEKASDYVQYVIEYDATVIEGRVVDNNGKGIENASVNGWAQSDIISINVKSDDNGYFRIVLPGRENHEYFLNVNDDHSGYNEDHPYRGFDNYAIRDTIGPGERQHLLIELGYDPFDLELDPDNGSLTRGWVENQYIYAKVESFIDTRQVVDHYEYEPSYTIRGGSPFHSLSAVHWDLIKLDGETLEQLESPDEDWWLNYYCRYFSNGKVRDREMLPNSFEEWPKGFHSFQGFANWYRHGVLDKWRSRYYIAYVPHTYRYLWRIAHYKIPVFRTEEYTRWRTTTHGIVDHALENWGSTGAVVTAVSRNGYEKDVQLVAEGDGVRAALGSPRLSLSSPASTTLTMSPADDIHGSPHPVTVFAYDANGRLVETRTYDLDLTTESKPPTENTVLSTEVTDKKPDESGENKWIPTSRVGVEGWVYDADTGEDLDPIVEVVLAEGWHPVGTQGNYYHWIAVGVEETKTMTIRASADGFKYQTKTATDGYGWSVARVDFYLERNPYE